MKRNHKLLDKIRARISLNLSITILAISGILEIMIFANSVKEETFNPITITLVVLLFLIFCIFTYISIDNIIKRETEKNLKKVKEILSDSYKLVKYEPEDISEMFELYMEANKKMYITLHARLDKNDNICYAIKDCKNNIICETRNQKYRFFLDNFYVYEYFYKSYDL